jgi:hypothetical protein
MVRKEIFFILALSTSVAQAGDLKERWFGDLKKAQETAMGKEAPASSFQNISDFQSKKFELKNFEGFRENGLEKKKFQTREFNFGSDKTAFVGKEFAAKKNVEFSRESSLGGESKYFTNKTSFFNDRRVVEERRAKEDGVKAVLDREKSNMSQKVYQGPEAAKISQEMKLINETLKNKEDLVDHKISLQEIREILNKNQ